MFGVMDCFRLRYILLAIGGACVLLGIVLLCVWLLGLELDAHELIAMSRQQRSCHVHISSRHQSPSVAIRKKFGMQTALFVMVRLDRSTNVTICLEDFVELQAVQVPAAPLASS